MSKLTAPRVEYDDVNDRAYVQFSNNEVIASKESPDELLVVDIDKDGELVGVEIMSVARLVTMAGYSKRRKKHITPDQIPTYLIRPMYQHCGSIY